MGLDFHQGLELARLRTGNLNSTLLNGTTLDNPSTILINNAPGYQLEFFSTQPDYAFDPNDCTTYGEERGQGLNLCVGSNRSTILAGFPSELVCVDLGWSVCPSDLYLTGNCFVDTNWRYPLEQTNVFKRHSTAAYDRRNLSILSVDSLSAPEVVEIDPRDLRSLFAKTLTPGPNATSDDTEMTNALLFQLGFVLRLTQDDFSDDKESPLNLLRGFLTIPIQFSTIAWQWVNATSFPLDLQSSRYLCSSCRPRGDSLCGATKLSCNVKQTMDCVSVHGYGLCLASIQQLHFCSCVFPGHRGSEYLLFLRN